MEQSDIGSLGRSWIGGREEMGGEAFHAEDPARGVRLEPAFRCASSAMVGRAAGLAAATFERYSELGGEDRARLLEAIASSLERSGGAVIARASAETGLGAERLAMEFARTTGTLRMFARLVRTEAWRRPAVDRPAPGAAPGTIPGHDVRSALLPLGPVAVFGASNFPLAYGVAGGDTASALAAGCPVIVKGHPAHPGTGEIMARAVVHGVSEAGADPGVFAFLHSGGESEMEVGGALVMHPEVRAVGFTGSFGGGMALVRLAATRREPIPVFAEMGSANPVLILPDAKRTRCEAIGEMLAASVLNSSGQQCTCPGLIFCVGQTRVERVLRERLEAQAANVMLSRRVRAGYHARVRACLGIGGVGCTPTLAAWARSEVVEHGPVTAPAGVLDVSFEAFAEHETLREEVFGPSVLVIRCDQEAELEAACAHVLGSLTVTIHAEDPSAELTRRVVRAARAKAGRVIWNGVPTGVRVVEGMVHGGPYPATNRPDTTAVGVRAIERWMRPVCFQNAPSAMLPIALRE